MDLRTSLPAAAVVLGCTLLVTARTAVAPVPLPRRSATLAERTDVAITIESQERTWASETAQNFPADSWSQRDDFHGRELRKAQELAKERGIRIEDVLRAVDEDIHRRASPATLRIPGAFTDRHANAVPCKPRPFYD